MNTREHADNMLMACLFVLLLTLALTLVQDWYGRGGYEPADVYFVNLWHSLVTQR